MFLSKRGGEQESLVQNKHKSTWLKVFSGKEERLNRVIFLVLFPNNLLTRYDMYREIRYIKGFRHIKKQNVCRRVNALHQQRWLETNGLKVARTHELSPLYQLGVRALAAIELDKRNLNDLLQNASEDQLQKVIDALKICP